MKTHVKERIQELQMVVKLSIVDLDSSHIVENEIYAPALKINGKLIFKGLQPNKEAIKGQLKNYT